MSELNELTGSSDSSDKALTLTLTQASSGDGEALADLRVAAMRESLERIGRFDPQRARERFLAGFSPRHTRHIEHAGVRVGFVSVVPHSDHLLLDHLYIHPEHQGRGVGAAVVEVVFAEADALRVPVRVGALRESASNRFYLRHGFRLVERAEWDNYYVRTPREGGADSATEEEPGAGLR